MITKKHIEFIKYELPKIQPNYRYNDLYISPEALKDIRKWDRQIRTTEGEKLAKPRTNNS